MHGCLTAYLTVMLLSNLGTAIFYMAALSNGKATTLPTPLMLIMATMCLLNLVLVGALFKWKKWGFYGFVGTTIIAFIINLYIGIGVYALIGLSGIPILFGVLKIGKERAGWHQLD